MGKPPVDFAGEGALSELPAHCSAYTERADIAEYDYDRVSLPVDSKPVPLAESVRTEHRGLISNAKQAMFSSSFDVPDCNVSREVMKPYCDPALFKDCSTYAKFLHCPFELGMIMFSAARGRTGNMGIFFVYKKDGSLRLIFDTRKLNKSFKTPPSVSLPTPAAFANVEEPSANTHVVRRGRTAETLLWPSRT